MYPEWVLCAVFKAKTSSCAGSQSTYFTMRSAELMVMVYYLPPLGSAVKSE